MDDYLNNLCSDEADHSVHNGVVPRNALYDDFHDDMADHNDESHDRCRCVVRYLALASSMDLVPFHCVVRYLDVASSMDLVPVHSLNFRTDHT